MPDTNLHARLSPELLARLRTAALADDLTIDEFLADAVERRLNRRELDEVFAFGRRHAKERGLRAADVARALSAVRGDAARSS